jgi:hypothetical protein
MSKTFIEQQEECKKAWNNLKNEFIKVLHIEDIISFLNEKLKKIFKI